ncbi:alpha/beta hydrolase [Desemzia sp. RIT804]|uniref:alpha/beta hydrolase n=1 Tax=Desemzia sp. RIT 804 TaxID=2810209 RepID=UPI0019502F62|nr:alpha/beta hydrolase [Desemzia sp. RIT 804]MBM6614925.1 alpha/beta hydrolase [Desemzia sp. RIT 804]
MHIEKIELDKKVNTSLTVYLHEQKKEFSRVSKRPFVLVLPGGGYNFCSEREAEPIALNFAAAGFNAGVLRYHVGEYRDFKEALADTEMAMRKIKSFDEAWQIDNEKIAVIGFSAGGHLAAALSTLSEYKPSLCILGYPAILKSFAEVMKIDAPSLDTCVTKETPPTFLFSTFEDNVVPIENSLLYLRALEEHEIPFESHIFQKGLHGLSLATKWFGNKETMLDHRFATWFPSCIEWMEINWASSKEQKLLTQDLSDIPLKLLCEEESSKGKLIEAFPSLKDNSRFKIVKGLSLSELNQIAPDKFPKEKLKKLISKLNSNEIAKGRNRSEL